MIKYLRQAPNNTNMNKFRINPISAMYHLVKNDVHKLTYDPISQFDFHRRMSFFWICNAGLVGLVYFFLNSTWQKFSVMYLIYVSLYANFATDYGAMPSSHAAIKGDEIEAAQTKPKPPTVDW